MVDVAYGAIDLWRSCKKRVDETVNDSAYSNSPIHFIWIRESQERYFFGKHPKSWFCTPLSPHIGSDPPADIVCKTCRWYDTESALCSENAHWCGELDSKISARDCLEGSFILADTEAWLHRDSLLHKRHYAAACLPPIGYVLDGSAVEVFDLMLQFVILGPLLGCICCMIKPVCRFVNSAVNGPQVDGQTLEAAAAAAAAATAAAAFSSVAATASDAYPSPPAASARNEPAPSSERRHIPTPISERCRYRADGGSGVGGTNGPQAPNRSRSGSATKFEPIRSRANTGDSSSSYSASPSEIIREIHEELVDNLGASELERKRLLRKHQMCWHPDKNIESRRDLATEVTQFLNSKRDWFLSPVPMPETATLLP